MVLSVSDATKRLIVSHIAPLKLTMLTSALFKLVDMFFAYFLTASLLLQSQSIISKNIKCGSVVYEANSKRDVGP